MAELHVSRKTISKLFSEMQGRKFIIPDFQRPYNWDLERCETLWNDIENFSVTEGKIGADYFLGTIVSYQNENKDLEIIDGQQRITSFFLMLRAFYRKLEDMSEDEDVIGLKNQLAPCIWDINPISQRVSDRTKIHIQSMVVTEDDNEVFHIILKSGDAGEEASDNYSANYRFFKKRCDDYAEKNPMQWKKLCVTILQQCIILPIECDAPETALTIFSTLNDRGLPLADSDIFKAQIYRNYSAGEERKRFTNTWKELTDDCAEAKISIDDIFRYYTHVLRARNGDKSKEVALRKFFAEFKYKRLKEESLMTDVMALANFWLCVNAGLKPEPEDGFVLSQESRKYLHCLVHYANEFWKYPTSVFFLRNVNSPTFDTDFTKLLKGLISYLFAKFVDFPTVNAIKDDIYSACIAIHSSNRLQLKYNFDAESFKKKLDDHASSRMSRAFLLLDAYLHKEQKVLVPETFEIEHIFPKKWQDTNYNGWSKTDAELFLDRFGNKIVFEKKLNIQAGNGYFGIKKEKYAKSEIANVLELSRYHKNDWTRSDIESREAQFKTRIVRFIEGE